MKLTTNQPWQALWLLAPLGIICYCLWSLVKKNAFRKLSKSYLLFFCCYVLLFSLASSSRLLDWKQTLAGLESSVPRNPLSLNWLGDWRYRVAPRTQSPTDLIILTLEHNKKQTLLESRRQIAQIIKIAADNGARGIAFDFYFTKESPLDPVIQHMVSLAKFPVLIGYTFNRWEDNDITRRPTAKTLESFLPLQTAQGHLVGFLEADNLIRAIPAYFKGEADKPALSVRIAHALTKEKITPPGLISFIAPEKQIDSIKYRELRDKPDAAGRLRDRFVIVGELSGQDIFNTPFGKLPGVVLHAYAAQSLRSGNYIKHESHWLSFGFVFALCFLVSVLAAEDYSNKALIGATAASSGLVIAISFAAIAFWRVWLAVIYPLAAVWILLSLHLILRKTTALLEHVTVVAADDEQNTAMDQPGVTAATGDANRQQTGTGARMGTGMGTNDPAASQQQPVTVEQRRNVEPIAPPRAAMAPENNIEPIACPYEPKTPKDFPLAHAPSPEMFVFAPLVMPNLSADTGDFVPSGNVVGYCAFKKDWLNRTTSGINNVVLAIVTSNSMAPTLKKKDLVMIDSGRNSIIDDLIYAIRVGDTFMLKRLQQKSDGTIRVVADNRAEYESYNAPREDLQILGQVIWSSRCYFTL